MKFILFILTLLFVNLYVYSQDIDSADADYCLALRTYPELLLVKQNNDLVIRTGEEPIMCESHYLGFSVLSEINFFDESGRSIVSLWGGGGVGHGGSWSRSEVVFYPLPTEIQIEKLPAYMSIGTLEISSKEKKTMFKKLLQFKNKIVDGNMTVSLYGCEPHKLEYKIKFRARITGECDCDFLKERALRWNIEWRGCK